MIQMRELSLLTLSSLLLLAGCKANTASRTSSDMDVNVAMQQAHARAASTPLSKDDAIEMNDGRPVIVCFGDSLTAGYGTNAGESYPDQLQRLLDEAGYRYRVVNLGISGETTKDGLARVDRVMSLKPAIVVVEFGGNDGLRGVPIASTRSNLDAILQKLTHSHSQITLAAITLPPQYGAEYIKNFDDTYKIEAKKYGLPLLPFLYKNVFGVPGSIQTDGIHATAQGNRQVAKNVFGLLEPMLKK